MKILFVEPPKEFWFVMGEYLPPPLGILQLAAFLEDKGDNWDLEVLDSQAERVNWKNLERRLESSDPDVVVISALATCNAYTVLRTVSMVKKIDPDIKTVVGGQHFTALAQESLEEYPEIDFIVRGEGELTLLELVKNLDKDKTPFNVRGLSYRHQGKVVHNPPRPLIHNLDDLPLPGYHFVADPAHPYHFKMMGTPAAGYATVEAFHSQKPVITAADAGGSGRATGAHASRSRAEMSTTQ
jgi:anaerobic magnesium-protoporphyrin IX monomethyl ester cyclase